MNQTLAQLEANLKSHDWYYDYSDDHRMWLKGETEYKAIRQLMAEAEKLGYQEQAIALYKQYMPKH